MTVLTSDIEFTRLLFQLLEEHDPTVEGERLAVLDFMVIHARIEREQR